MRKLFVFLTLTFMGCDAHKDVDVDIETKERCFRLTLGSSKIYYSCVEEAGYVLVYSRFDGGYIYAKKLR